MFVIRFNRTASKIREHLTNLAVNELNPRFVGKQSKQDNYSANAPVHDNGNEGIDGVVGREQILAGALAKSRFSGEHCAQIRLNPNVKNDVFIRIDAE